MTTTTLPVNTAQRLLTYVLCIWMVLYPVSPVVAAPVIADNPGTLVDRAGNGVPVINIATPGSSGISHNTWQQFNTGPEGLILNNSTEQLTSSHLGGLIQNNPNLIAGKEATAIINEVTGATRSEINGFIEVAGKEAAVMVANPYGITCNGCGFINVPQAVLTTGKPVMNAHGDLQALDVTRGVLTFNGKGLNAQNTDAVTLISRATEINAELHADDLTILTGAQRLDRDGKSTPLQVTGEKPQLAIDTKGLGGMYANRIRLVAAEEGVGVNLSNVTARQGDIQLDIRGRLVLKNSYAHNTLTAEAGEIELRGNLVSGKNTDLRSRGEFVVSNAEVRAGENASLVTEGTLKQKGGSLATDNPDGQITLKGRRLTLEDNSLSSGNITLSGTQGISQNKNSSTVAQQSVTINSDGMVVLDGKTTAGKILSVTADTLNSAASSELSAGADAVFTARNVYQKGNLTAGRDFTIKSGTTELSGQTIAVRDSTVSGKVVRSNGVLQAGRNQLVTAGDFQQSGKIRAGNQLTIEAETAEISGEAGSLKNTELAVSQKLSLSREGKLTAGDTLNATTGSAGLQGTVYGKKQVILNADDLLSTAVSSRISSDGNLTISSNTLDIAGEINTPEKLSLLAKKLTGHEFSHVSAQKELSILAEKRGDIAGIWLTEGLLNLNGGDITSSGKIQGAGLKSETRTLTNTGTLRTSGDSDITTGTLVQKGTLHSDDKLTLTAGTLRNNGVLTAAGGQLTASDLLTNDTEGYLSAQQLTIRTGTLLNLGKLLSSDSELISGVITNKGLIQTKNTQVLKVAAELTNGDQGQIISGSKLTLATPETKNQGIIQSGTLRLDGEQLNNSGTLSAQNGLVITQKSAVQNSGKILSDGALSLNTARMVNDGSLITGDTVSAEINSLQQNGQFQGKTLILQGSSLVNSGNMIGTDGLTLIQTNQIENSAGGKLLSDGDITADTQSLINAGLWQSAGQQITAADYHLSGIQQAAGNLDLILRDGFTIGSTGELSSGKHLTLNAVTGKNSGKISGSAVTLNSSDLFNNGRLWSGTNLALTAAELTQSENGKIQAGKTLSYNGEHWRNAGLFQGDNLEISAVEGDNSGTIQAENLSIRHQQVLNNLSDGRIQSGKTMTLITPVVTNDGVVKSGGSGSAEITQSLTNHGTIDSGDELELTTPVLDNSGLIQGKELALSADTVINNGKFVLDGPVRIDATVLTNHGHLQGGILTVNTPELINTSTLFALNNLTVTAGKLNNQGKSRIYSGGNMALSADTLIMPEQLTAIGDISADSQSSLLLNGTVAAGQRAVLSAKGDIRQTGTLQGKQITLNSTGKTDNDGNIIAGQQGLSITAGQITQAASGKIQSAGDLRITSGTSLNNNGFTGAKGDVVLSALTRLTNNHGLLYAGKNMTLLADELLNDRGDILAGNDLTIQRADGHAGKSVTNRSGNIETTTGDIRIKTQQLLNERAGLTTSGTDEDLQVKYPWLKGEKAGWEWNRPDNAIDVPFDYFSPGEYGYYTYTTESCSGAENDNCITTRHAFGIPNDEKQQLNIPLKTSTISVNSDGPSARLIAGRDMILSADKLTNRASTVAAGRNAVLTGSQLTNESWFAGTESLIQQYKFIGVIDQSDNHDLEVLMPEENKYLDKGTPFSSFYSQMGRAFKKRSLRSVRYIPVGTPVLTRSEDSELYRSVITAGETLTADFSDKTDNGTTVANATDIQNTLTAPDMILLSVPAAQQADQKKITGTTTASVPAVAEIQSLLQSALQDSGITKNALQDYPVPQGENGLFVLADKPDSIYLITANPVMTDTGQQDNALFSDLYALLNKQGNTPPQESRPEFTDKNQFIGSGYFMSRLNLNPEFDYRFLGDAAFDTRYVSNAVLQQTGRRYIHGVGSDLAQMQTLIDNAAAAQQKLGLKFGVSLSAEQAATLDNSLLWWEEITVGDQKILAPKVYLAAKDTGPLTGSTIVAGDIRLTTGELRNTASTILADNDLSVQSRGEIRNTRDGNLKSDGKITLQAEGDIINSSAKIAGKDISLSSESGDIRNETESTQIHIERGDKNHPSYVFDRTMTGTQSRIEATNDLSLRAGNSIKVSGATVQAGEQLILQAGQDIVIGANTLTDNQSEFSRRYQSEQQQQTHQQSVLSAGKQSEISAGNDILLTAGQIHSGNNTDLTAGRDIQLNSAGNNTFTRKDGVSVRTDEQKGSQLTAGNDLRLSAGRDLLAQAAGLAADNSIVLTAGQDIDLSAADTSIRRESHSGRRHEITESHRRQSTELAAGRDIQITGKRDVTGQALQADAAGDIKLTAGRDAMLTSSTESDYRFFDETKVKKKLLSKTVTRKIEEDYSTHEKGSLLSGQNITVAAGRDTGVIGSAIAGDGDVSITADRDASITAATEEHSSYRLSQKKKSGLFSGGAIGFTIGSQSSKHRVNEEGTTQSQSASTVGSTSGNVSVTSGGKIHIGGSDVIGQQDIALKGDSITLDPGADKLRRDEHFEQRSSGISLSLSGAIGNAVNTAYSTTRQAKEETDGRLKTLQGTKAVLSGVQLYQANEQIEAAGGEGSAIGISISLGTQSSSSDQHLAQKTLSGSTLSAGRDIAVTATGEQSGRGDIAITSGQLKAGRDTTLSAQRDIILDADADTRESTGSNKSSGGNIGLSIGVGGKDNGIQIFANANSSRGKDKGNGAQWLETTVDSGKSVTLDSRQDTTLRGAQVNSDKITVSTGRDLVLQSQQDSDRYDSKQTSVSGGFSIPIYGSGGSASFSLSQDKIHSNYDSVQEQTGLYAGKGGFDVITGRHTQLDGAVITGSTNAEKNSLETGTLGFRDIQNKAEFKTQHTGAGISSGGSFGMDMVKNAAGNLLSQGGNQGNAEGITYAAVSDGSITIRDTAGQYQNVDDLSRDTEHANNSISPIFNKEKEQKRLQQVQLIGEIGGQVIEIYDNNAKITAMRDATEKLKSEGAQSQIKENTDAEFSKLRGKGDTKTSYEAVLKGETDKYYNDLVSQTLTDNKQQVGGKERRAVTAVVAAFQGLAGGDVKAAIANGAAPYLAGMVKDLTYHGKTYEQLTPDEKATNLVAHALLGGVLAEMNGGSVTGGAAGALTGELAAPVIADLLFNKKVSDLNADEKAQLSQLSTLAGGLAGGIASDSVAGGISGSQTAKNAVENNAFNLAGRTQKEIESSIQKQADGIDLDAVYGDDQSKKDAYRKGREQGVNDGLKDGAIEVLEGTANSILHPVDTVTDLASAIWNYDQTIDAIKVSATQWNELYEYAKVNDPELAGKMFGSMQGRALGNLGTSVVVSGAAAKTIQKVAQLKSGSIKAKPNVKPNVSEPKGKPSPNTAEDAIKKNLEASRKGNESSKFGDYLTKEEQVFANKAQQELVNEIGKFKSNTQAEKIATMIGAYDSKTGKTAVGYSNKTIAVDSLHPTTVSYIEKQLGVKIGEFTSFCKNKAGACAEVLAADSLVRQGARPENIKFTDALRPKAFRQENGNLSSGKVIIETCDNCKVTWPKGTK